MCPLRGGFLHFDFNLWNEEQPYLNPFTVVPVTQVIMQQMPIKYTIAWPKHLYLSSAIAF